MVVFLLKFLFAPSNPSSARNAAKQSMSPRLYLSTTNQSCLQFHRYSALHIGHRIQTLDLSGLPTKPRPVIGHSATQTSAGPNDERSWGVSSLQVYPGGHDQDFFFRSLLVFWALRPYDPWKPEANPQKCRWGLEMFVGLHGTKKTQTWDLQICLLNRIYRTICVPASTITNQLDVGILYNNRPIDPMVTCISAFLCLPGLFVWVRPRHRI